MKLYVKQKVFSFRDSFTVKDEFGNDRYNVVGDFFSFPKTLHIYGANGEEALKIQRKLFTFLPRYQLYRGGNLAAEIAKEFTFFTPKYYITAMKSCETERPLPKSAKLGLLGETAMQSTCGKPKMKSSCLPF